MTFPSSASPPWDPSTASGDDTAWYGNIQYLLNICAAGSAFCVLLFLLVKLRLDHRRLPGPSALLAKLLSVWHATPRQVSLRSGADTTINNIPKGSPLLWVHFVLMVLIAIIAHFGISSIADRLRITRLRDDSSVAIFTIMVQGVPRTLAADKAPLEEYFRRRYPGKVYRVVVPFDLCSLDDLAVRFSKVCDGISRLECCINSDETGFDGSMDRLTRLKGLFRGLCARLGFTDEEKLRSLMILKMRLESELLSFKEGRASGAGIAFVVFKDVYTTNKALQDFRTDWWNQRPTGQFFSVMEQMLEKSWWRVERAPPAADIYWTHLGLGKLSLGLRRVAVNTCLLLMLLFCSSPLSIISALKSAGRIINAEAMDHAELWWASLFMGSSWGKTIFFQFLPNVLIFISMYIIIPSALSYLSKFERHLTVSGEQRAALLKMRTIKKFRKNDMLELVPEQNEECPLENHEGEVDDTLQRPLISDTDVSGNGIAQDVEGRVLSVYPINRSFHVPKQTFDFAQYYAFNLTIFALTMIYSLFAPLVVPVGVFYFGYRYLVDKASGFPAGNDGRLMDRVLCIMHFCVVLFLLSMLLFFSVQGDSTKLQAIFTLGILVIYKLMPMKNDGYQPSLLEGMQTVDSIVDGITDYEIPTEFEVVA
ncbi:hypothetical protein QJS10_CPA01g00354 [Acorus calamus]|uniref:Uncharacterized protein n=1 Tax=Acorus calamus TaxID=4465 RepID=A0AAV9FNF9_ACOCL|nr:hypothetical protein QJS10_CPA01g00354 [Acorus calamus]